MSVPPSTSPTRLMSHRPFRLFWLARVAATGAFQMQAVAIGWQIYDLTGSAFDLGLVGLVQFVPAVFLALLVGHVADRYDRRLIVRVCQIVEATAAATLTVGSIGGWLSTPAILGVVFAIGAARAFELPTMHALVPGLVPPALLSRGVAGSASANQIAVVVGPAVGGVIYVAGPFAVYLTCAVLFLVASVLVTLIRMDLPPPERKAVSLDSLFAGFAFIWSRRILVGVILLDLFAVLLGGATALLPIYARDILSIGPEGLGALRSAPALGALATSILLAHYPIRRHAGRMLFASVAAFGLATTVFAVSTSFVLSLGALCALGAADSISVVIRFSLVQLGTPHEVRGRVSAVNYLFVNASNTLGDFRSGLTAAWFGVVPAVLIGGIGTLAIAAAWLRAYPELARVDSLEIKS